MVAAEKYTESHQVSPFPKSQSLPICGGETLMASIQLGLKPLQAWPAFGTGSEYPETPSFPSRAVRRPVLFHSLH